ncbi:MAG: phosphohistidine phosphatase, SixA [Acidobacteriaceae bacterium]|nr:phosphohistidine phosphatase, SixA [Acidobacteriaceae bacterium]
MIVYFLRHASAGQSLVNPNKDEKRPLDAEGARQCGYIGRALASMQVHVDAIVSSPLKRALQTASLVGNEMGYEGKFFIENGLRPEADFSVFKDMLQSYRKSEAIMVVGHNPSLQEFLASFISSSGCKTGVELKKGAIARVDTGAKLNLLQWCMTPKMVKAVYDSATAKSRPKTSRK